MQGVQVSRVFRTICPFHVLKRYPTVSCRSPQGGLHHLREASFSMDEHGLGSSILLSPVTLQRSRTYEAEIENAHADNRDDLL